MSSEQFFNSFEFISFGVVAEVTPAEELNWLLGVSDATLGKKTNETEKNKGGGHGAMTPFFGFHLQYLCRP